VRVEQPEKGVEGERRMAQGVDDHRFVNVPETAMVRWVVLVAMFLVGCPPPTN